MPTRRRFAAAKADKSLPDGSVLLVEVYTAKLDGDKPVTGGDGFFVADKLLLYTAMARDAGCSGAEIRGLLFDLLTNLFEFLGQLGTGSSLREPGTCPPQR
jgi:hypothetical protein